MCFVFGRVFVTLKCQLLWVDWVIGDAPLVDPHSLIGGVFVFIQQSLASPETRWQDGCRIVSWIENKLHLFLLGAIPFELLGTMLLPASKNFTKLLPSAILAFSYLFSFYCLSLTVGKLPLSLVYSTWAGLGVFIVTLLSYFIYHQKISWQMVIGLFLIVTGVVIVNIYKTETQLTSN